MMVSVLQSTLIGGGRFALTGKVPNPQEAELEEQVMKMKRKRRGQDRVKIDLRRNGPTSMRRSLTKI